MSALKIAYYFSRIFRFILETRFNHFALSFANIFIRTRIYNPNKNNKKNRFQFLFFWKKKNTCFYFIIVFSSMWKKKITVRFFMVWFFCCIKYISNKIRTFEIFEYFLFHYSFWLSYIFIYFRNFIMIL